MSTQIGFLHTLAVEPVELRRDLRGLDGVLLDEEADAEIRAADPPAGILSLRDDRGPLSKRAALLGDLPCPSMAAAVPKSNAWRAA